MAKEVLVDFPREVGWKLLEALDVAELQVNVAYWRYVEEDDAWRLVIATPLVETQGPLMVYRVMQNILREMSDERDDLTLSDISVVNPHLMEVEDLRTRYGVVDQGRGRVVRRTLLGYKEPFIYRLK